MPEYQNVFGKPACAKYGVGGVPGFDMVVYGEGLAGDRTEPDFMIASSLAIEAATGLSEDPFYGSCVAGRQWASLMASS